ncbi:MAG: hypothetical protein ACREM3_09165 [Candidatus Rokuibacteriota bacterium]
MTRARESLRAVLALALPALVALPHAVPQAHASDQRVTPTAQRRDELRDANDLLWLLESDRRALGAELRSALERLDRSSVPTVEKATSAALRFEMAHGGITAEEGARVVGLLRIGRDVPSFAGQGDLVWVVRIDHSFSGVTQEMWISSTTGQVRTMLPMAKGSR